MIDKSLHHRNVEFIGAVGMAQIGIPEKPGGTLTPAITCYRTAAHGWLLCFTEYHYGGFGSE
jgi:hypothetical protein